MSFLCSLNICGFGTSENASRQYFVTDSEAEDSLKRKLISLSQVTETFCVCPIHEEELWRVVGAQLGTISVDLAEFSCHERSIPLRVCTLFWLSELLLLGSGWSRLAGRRHGLGVFPVDSWHLVESVGTHDSCPCVRKHYPHSLLQMASERGWSRGRDWLCKVTASLLSDHLFIAGYNLSGDHLHPEFSLGRSF